MPRLLQAGGGMSTGFNVGDVVAVTSAGALGRPPRKHTIAKLYKTGHVILDNGDRFRQDGAAVGDRGYCHTRIEHWTCKHDRECLKASRLAKARLTLSLAKDWVAKMDLEELYQFVQALRQFRRPLSDESPK